MKCLFPGFAVGQIWTESFLSEKNLLSIYIDLENTNPERKILKTNQKTKQKAAATSTMMMTSKSPPPHEKHIFNTLSLAWSTLTHTHTEIHNNITDYWSTIDDNRIVTSNVLVVYGSTTSKPCEMKQNENGDWSVRSWSCLSFLSLSSSVDNARIEYLFWCCHLRVYYCFSSAS